MPLLDGCAATAEIKRRWPAVAVIALTMYAAEQSAALAAGVDAFLIKGAAPEQLVVALGIGAAHSQR
jgi:CheY-like chemotaxis protein